MDRPAASPQPAGAPPDPSRLTSSPIQANALVHLYRAEVGRMTTYRVRLDTTTNWALSSSLLAATFTLGNALVTHAAFLFLMLLLQFFLQLEARRFRAYQASRRRVQLLEAGFYADLLGAAGWSNWSAELLELLRNPAPLINRQGALGWRLRRSYAWIYLAVLIAWLAKLGSSGWPSAGLPEFVDRASVGMLPGWLVLLAVLAFYVWLASLTLLAGRRDPLGDDETSVYPQDPVPQE